MMVLLHLTEEVNSYKKTETKIGIEMREVIQEIFTSMRRNKLRTLLTGFSVSWGIFIFIVLLAAGNGLKHGVLANFTDRSINRINLFAGHTSKVYNGLKKGRYLSFRDKQLSTIKNGYKETNLISPKLSTALNISFGNEYTNGSIVGVMPDYTEIENLELDPHSRFINNFDIEQRLRVVVLDKKIADIIFNNRSPLNEHVKIGSLMYKVVGINVKKRKWGHPCAYVPYSTYQAVYNNKREFEQLLFTVDGLNTKSENMSFEEEIRATLGKEMNFDPEDKSALYISNSLLQYIQTQQIFWIITLFVGIIGVLTLISGIVGVSNIMLVSVKERTREIGICKALGATPAKILKNIVLESLIITSIFGAAGIMLGIFLTEGVNYAMEKMMNGSSDSGEIIFLDPTVNIYYVLVATLILIVAGIIAGYYPAKNAVRIKPVEAMRHE